MSELDAYMRAMIRGYTSTCASIEQRHGLYGYPPEIVSVGLKAVDDGEDCHAAIDAYLTGADDAR